MIRCRVKTRHKSWWTAIIVTPRYLRARGFWFRYHIPVTCDMAFSSLFKIQMYLRAHTAVFPFATHTPSESIAWTSTMYSSEPIKLTNAKELLSGDTLSMLINFLVLAECLMTLKWLCLQGEFFQWTASDFGPVVASTTSITSGSRSEIHTYITQLRYCCTCINETSSLISGLRSAIYKKSWRSTILVIYQAANFRPDIDCWQRTSKNCNIEFLEVFPIVHQSFVFYTAMFTDWPSNSQCLLKCRLLLPTVD